MANTLLKEEERREIANELHDEAGQLLTSVGLRLKALEGRVAPDAAEEIVLAEALKPYLQYGWQPQVMAMSRGGSAWPQRSARRAISPRRAASPHLEIRPE